MKHHAQAFTVGTTQIDIPANGTASVTGEWHAPADLNLVSISTHQHRRGTDILVHMIDAAGNDMGELVDSPSWEHPSVRWFQQAMRLQAGEGFRFTCSWQNPDDHPVHFGVTSEDEMCFVTGYFYPDVRRRHGDGARLPSAGSGSGVLRSDDSLSGRSLRTSDAENLSDSLGGRRGTRVR